jgi:hypothetical protein
MNAANGWFPVHFRTSKAVGGQLRSLLIGLRCIRRTVPSGSYVVTWIGKALATAIDLTAGV